MRSSSSRCVSAAEHHTAEQYSKTGKTKPQKHLPMSNLSWKTRQDFLKIPSLWEAALETEWRCFSKVNLESNVTPNISRSSDSFSTVLSMVRILKTVNTQDTAFTNLKSTIIDLITQDSSGIDRLQKESSYSGSIGQCRSGRSREGLGDRWLGVDTKRYAYKVINCSLLK